MDTIALMVVWVFRGWGVLVVFMVTVQIAASYGLSDTAESSQRLRRQPWWRGLQWDARGMTGAVLASRIYWAGWVWHWLH